MHKQSNVIADFPKELQLQEVFGKVIKFLAQASMKFQMHQQLAFDQVARKMASEVHAISKHITTILPDLEAEKFKATSPEVSLKEIKCPKELEAVKISIIETFTAAQNKFFSTGNKPYGHAMIEANNAFQQVFNFEASKALGEQPVDGSPALGVVTRGERYSAASTFAAVAGMAGSATQSEKIQKLEQAIDALEAAREEAVQVAEQRGQELAGKTKKIEELQQRQVEQATEITRLRAHLEQQQQQALKELETVKREAAESEKKRAAEETREQKLQEQFTTREITNAAPIESIILGRENARLQKAVEIFKEENARLQTQLMATQSHIEVAQETIRLFLGEKSQAAHDFSLKTLATLQPVLKRFEEFVATRYQEFTGLIDIVISEKGKVERQKIRASTELKPHPFHALRRELNEMLTGMIAKLKELFLVETRQQLTEDTLRQEQKAVQEQLMQILRALTELQCALLGTHAFQAAAPAPTILSSTVNQRSIPVAPPAPPASSLPSVQPAQSVTSSAASRGSLPVPPPSPAPRPPAAHSAAQAAQGIPAPPLTAAMLLAGRSMLKQAAKSVQQSARASDAGKPSKPSKGLPDFAERITQHRSAVASNWEDSPDQQKRDLSPRQ